MDNSEETTLMMGTDAEMKEILGLYDVPAFARRGQELDYALDRFHARFARERLGMLDMVRLRLKQWAAIAEGPLTASGIFSSAIDPLWSLADAPCPVWSGGPGPTRKLGVAAKELVASVERFNRRWTRFVAQTNADLINAQIDGYNRYYVLEKECSLNSARLAARSFVPKPKLSASALEAIYPPLPVPELRS